MPADTTRFFVALRPDETLDARVRGYKRRLLAAAGPQMYVSDPPHTTLYLAEIARVHVSELGTALERLAETIPMPAMTIDGWHVFPSDPLTGHSTLVCRFDDRSCQRLRRVQAEVLKAAVPLHDAKATQAAIQPRWASLSSEQQQSVCRCGFPYIGEGWVPHLTIASVRPEQWPHVLQVFNLSQPPAGNAESTSPAGRFVALDLFELHGLEPHHVAGFPLAERQVGKVALA